jgi:hypothetical protein
MNCNDARAALLIADPDDLASDGSMPLALHLRGCAQCQSIAMSLTNDLTAMRVMTHRRSTRRTTRLVLLAGIPVAAAIAGIVVTLPEKEQAPAAAEVNTHRTNVVSVEVARGQHATVFKTSDPKVTVVWLTPGGGDVNP